MNPRFNRRILIFDELNEPVHQISHAVSFLLQDPGSDVYRKALDMTKKAPELHAELQRQLAASGEVR